MEPGIQKGEGMSGEQAPQSDWKMVMGDTKCMNDVFWSGVGGVFDLTSQAHAFCEELAEKEGLDFDALVKEAEEKAPQTRQERRCESYLWKLREDS